MRILLATVWHTGSNYLRLEYKRNRNKVVFQHTGWELWNNDSEYFDRYIVTTLRDPWLVGASWANRYDMNSAEYRWNWFMVWSGWERLLSYDPEIRLVSEFTGRVERSIGDPKGVYAMLEKNDQKGYYKMMPKDLIRFAQKIVKKA